MILIPEPQEALKSLRVHTSGILLKFCIAQDVKKLICNHLSCCKNQNCLQPHSFLGNLLSVLAEIAPAVPPPAVAITTITE